MKKDNITPEFYEFDARIVGRITNDERQIDFLFGWKNPTRTTASEFKEYMTRSVTVTSVEAFSAKIKDIGVTKGLMISPHGFQRGAIRTAQHHNIGLLRLRELSLDELRHQRPDLPDFPADAETRWLLERPDDNAAWVFSGKLI